MMRKPKLKALARRERQIIDVLYKLERATVGQVVAALPDHPNYSTVRAQLRVLEEKGHARHEEHGLRYVYFPAVPRNVARRSALRNLIETFFDGSAERERRADREHPRQHRTCARISHRVLCKSNSSAFHSVG